MVLEFECVLESPGVGQLVVFTCDPLIDVVAVAVEGDALTRVVTVKVFCVSSAVSSPLLFTKCNFPSSATYTSILVISPFISYF